MEFLVILLAFIVLWFGLIKPNITDPVKESKLREGLNKLEIGMTPEEAHNVLGMFPNNSEHNDNKTTKIEYYTKNFHTNDGKYLNHKTYSFMLKYINDKLKSIEKI